MIDRSLLRDLVKSVIAEEVAAIHKPNGGGAAAPAPAEERVAIASDGDLAAFARRVLSLAGDPAKAKEIAAGRYPFRLARQVPQHAPAPQPSAPPAAAPAQSHRIDSGIVTESTLNRLPRGLSRLLLGPGVTVTPLARDRARALGLTFERMKP